jgi:hypothetical protein
MAGPPVFEQSAEEAEMIIRRSGTTLIEVLVAIFVTAIGLLGLLALFPLGAVNMAQAIKDSRCGQAAANAFSVAQAMNIRNDPVVVGGPPADVFVDCIGRPPANPNGPSYPVYVDPLGLSNGMPASLGAQGGHGSPGIPRRNVGFVASAPAGHNLATAIQWFSLLDDINFVKDGQYIGLACQPTIVLSSHGGSAVAQPGNLQSEGRYTWAYLLRRPRSSEKSVVDVTVVVYSGRPTVFGQGENSYSPVTFDTTSNVVRVYWTAGQQKPAVRTGGWILDATMVRSSPGVGPQGAQVVSDPHGFFYRVVNITDGVDSRGPYVDLELQTNPRAGTTQGVLVVLDGVVEVFDKGPGWRP